MSAYGSHLWDILNKSDKELHVRQPVDEGEPRNDVEPTQKGIHVHRNPP